MNNELITTIANVSLALSFLAALVFGISQVRAAARDRRERLTLETLENFQTREFAELIHFVNSQNFPATEIELRALPEDQQVRLIQYGQQMEGLGILVAEKLINLDLVDKTLGSFVVTSWEKYKPMFLSMREKEPYTGEYFQWLAEWIEQRLRESPRKPFHQQ